MKVACLPASLPTPLGSNILRFDLYGREPSAGRGRVGGLVPPVLKRLRLAPTERAWDFASIALAVVAADEAVSRLDSPDGWTRQIELIVAVAAPAFWDTQKDELRRALDFLTGDIWSLTFVPGGHSPAPPNGSRPRPENVVCLLSGGMDSLVGAIDAVAAGQRPLLVSQKAKGDSADQLAFAKRISPGTLHLQLSHNARPPGPSERSQRGRSIVFLAFGVLAASSLAVTRDGGSVDLLVPENGFISQNVPLTPLRTGSLSTRTTHPFYFRQLQKVLNAAGLSARISNPYEFKTKGEMLAECRDQAILDQLAWSSTSCGRYSRTGFQHCGRCVPCQVRRGAVTAWGKADRTAKGYKYDPLGQRDRWHTRFDDVRSVAMAIDAIAQNGLEHWIGGAMNGEMLGDVAPYRDVVGRGIAELATLHQHLGVT
ncbi:Qat anti-phage system QueC-like protein QatC [Sphingomonas adhaesiva]|uniref:Qat anti-phage system QueC-like protein QatC n=1 Tax=Sphingomonas adhaesiva TaxID=28212 RepID=UPI002FF855AD